MIYPYHYSKSKHLKGYFLKYFGTKNSIEDLLFWDLNGRKCCATCTYNDSFGIAELLYKSIFHDKEEMDINVLGIIADYAIVSIVNCGNAITECRKTIKLGWSENNEIAPPVTANTELFAIKDHAIASHAKDMLYNKYPTGCDFMQPSADMKICDDLDCANIICGICSVRYKGCDGIECM